MRPMRDREHIRVRRLSNILRACITLYPTITLTRGARIVAVQRKFLLFSLEKLQLPILLY